jgi:hypothetical protein
MNYTSPRQNFLASNSRVLRSEQSHDSRTLQSESSVSKKRNSLTSFGHSSIQAINSAKSPSRVHSRALTAVGFSGIIKEPDINLRSGPGTNFSIVGNLGKSVGQTRRFDGWDTGTPIWDAQAKAYDNKWFRLQGTNQWVTSAFINGNPPPTGGLHSNPSASNPLKGFQHPFKKGSGTSGGHDASYGQGSAKDFGSAAGATFGASVFAMRGGTVVSYQDATADRNTSLSGIDDGRSGTTANYILVKLDDNDGVDDNYKQMYLHLQKGSIPASLKKVGARVNTGDKVGAVGYNGYAFGVHLHTEVNKQTGNNLWQRQTQPFQWD